MHTDDGVKKFGNIEGLYLHKPDSVESFQEEFNQLEVLLEEPMDPYINYRSDKSFVVTTVNENLKHYSKREIEEAKKARELYTNTGHPTIENLKILLKNGLIRNCSVKPEHLDRAEAIYGPDVGTLKGKLTRRSAKRVKVDQIQIPPEIVNKHQNLTWCFDIFFVNGLPFLTGIILDIRFRTCSRLKNRTNEAVYDAIDQVTRLANSAGYRIKEMRCDPEFKPLMNPVKDELNVDMWYAPPKQHEPNAERNNRVLGERVCATYHRLPYKTIPKLILEYLALECTKQLNIFPAKGGVSPYFSPHRLMGGSEVDANHDLKYTFGSYCICYDAPVPYNSNLSRGLDAIYLRALPNGSHQLMDLYTGRSIERVYVKPVPVTPLVIQAVEAMGLRQGIKSLKIKNKGKTIFYPADWIAGVDYEEDLNPQSDDDDDDDSDYSYSSESDDESLDSDDSELDDDDTIDPDALDDVEERPQPKDTMANPTVEEDDPPDLEQQDQADESDAESVDESLDSDDS